MSRHNKDERREFEGDVFVEAWRRGLNPDRASDCASDCYYEGRTPTQCVDGYEQQVRRQQARRQEERELEERQEREYYEEMERRHWEEMQQQIVEQEQPK